MSSSLNPMDCSLSGSSVRRILQARILEWVAISFSKGSSWPRDRTYASCAGRQIDLTVVVQLLRRIQLFATPWTVACPASLSFTMSQSLLRFISIESVMPSNHLILCHPLLLLILIFPRIKVFPNKLALHIRWPKYLSIKVTKVYNIIILILAMRKQRPKEVA